jgi:hypothetical protein
VVPEGKPTEAASAHRREKPGSYSIETRTERRDVQVAEALGGAAEGSYEQGAAAVEEDEEMEREDERGMAKRPDLNELDVPEWADWHWIK